MSDPAQQVAARGALQEAARYFGVDVRDLIVKQVLRRRRAGTKVPFYYVAIEDRSGTRLTYQVSDAGARVELDYPKVPTPAQKV